MLVVTAQTELIPRLEEGGINSFDENLEALEEELGIQFSEPVIEKLRYETVLSLAENEGKMVFYEFGNGTSKLLWPSNGTVVNPQPVNPVCEDLDNDIQVISDILVTAICM